MIFILLLLLTTQAHADYNVTAKAHIETKMEMVIFHDLTYAKVFADDYQGRIEIRPNHTFIVWYPVTEAVTTPSDWRDS